MDAARKRVEYQSQKYAGYWPAVLFSERAEAKGRELAIMYAAFPRCLNRTLADLLESLRMSGSNGQKINVAEIISTDDVPNGLKMSYTLSDDGLMVCDLWTPVQPQLFGVEPRPKGR